MGCGFLSVRSCAALNSELTPPPSLPLPSLTSTDPDREIDTFRDANRRFLGARQ